MATTRDSVEVVIDSWNGKQMEATKVDEIAVSKMSSGSVDRVP